MSLKQDTGFRSLTKLVPMDGNAAAANVAYNMSEATFLYPITPSTPMGEAYDSWASQGKTNVWGHVPSVRVLQSEAGAAGALHGAASVGTFATTFTASQGLLLMIPNMLKTAGELWPTVFHVAARAVSTQALSIYGDHSDIMHVRNTGFAFLSSSTVQECQDLAAVSHMSTVESEIPFVHFFEGFRLSHQIDSINALSKEEMAKLMPFEKLESIRKRALNPAHPMVLGHSQGPDAYFQTVELGNKYYNNIPGIVQNNFDKFYKLTGRKYNLFDYFGHPDAEDVIVMMGAGAPVVREAMELMLASGDKVGLVVPRLFRPWTPENFIAALPPKTKRIAVMDRSKDPAAAAEPLFMDVSFSVKSLNHKATVIGGRYGLASREFTPPHVKAVFNNLRSEKPIKRFTVGINDDVNHISLPNATLEGFGKANGTYQVVFWGLGGDGTIGANKSAIKAAIDQKNLYGQAYFSYSADKSNSLTRSYLRFSDKPITSQYNIISADLVGCTLPAYVLQYPLADRLKEGGSFLLNFPVNTVEGLSRALPASLKRQLAKKKAKLYVIDATGIADKCGLPGKISTIIQGCFYNISGILGSDHNTTTEKWIEKEFGRLGEDVVRKNKKAAKAASDALVEVPVPPEWENAVDAPHQFPSRVGGGADEYITDVVMPTLATAGGSLPVSAFKHNLGGVSPIATSKWLKKGLSLKIPEWDKEKCVQCNMCSAVCPHSVIRPYLFTTEELESMPADIKVDTLKDSRKGSEYRFRIHVSPYDCVGCELCVNHCPTQALSMREIASEQGALFGKKQSDAFLWMQENLKPKPIKGDLFNVKNSQFSKPLIEFPGSCAGCTETAVTKIVTQLFGERMIIANTSGCSSVWGGAFPKIPFTTSHRGRGPAWARSLFEDNAEFGFGQSVGLALRRHSLLEKVTPLCEKSAVLKKWVEAFSDGNKTLDLYDEIIAEVNSREELKSLRGNEDLWVKPSNWILGGDGWAYDIGFGGLDHILASKADFNILVFDNEVYSNTGGQQSKATQLSATAQFAAAGKDTCKKDLAMMMMNYENAYVATVSMANSKDIKHLIKCLKEAESFDGPSLIICYCNCILHHIKGSIGAGGAGGKKAAELATDSGYWPLYSFDPRREKEGKNPLEIVSKRPDMDKIEQFLDMQARFSVIKRSHPKVAQEMREKLHQSIDRRYRKLEALREAYQPRK